MSDEAFTDIANAVLRLRHAFLKHNLNPPASLELASHDDAAKLRDMLPREMVMATPSMGNDPARPDIVFPVCGVEMRYPAEFRARERGGFDIV
jgi:hypothetical protein